MRRWLFAVLALATLATLAPPSLAALAEGEAAPEFTVKASRGGHAFDFSLREALRRGPVVVYFFPAAFTASCDIQAHEFAVQHDKFAAAGATVIGVSLDDIERLNKYSADPDYCGGKVAVASDTDGSIAKAYELRVMDAPPGSKDTQGHPIAHGLVESYVFVVAPDGGIAAAIGGGSSPAANVAKALETVRKLAAKQTAAR